MELTTEELGEQLAVSHASVVKWEKEQAKMNPVYDVYIRMLFTKMLRDKEISSIFDEIKPEILAEAENELMKIDAADLLKTAV